MKNIILSTLLIIGCYSLIAQPTVYPEKKVESFLIENATVHQGNGNVLYQTSVYCDSGKIVKIGKDLKVPENTKKIQAEGKHLYPGLILASSDIGIKEIGSGVKGTNDVFELGDNNADIKTIVAYNANSLMINNIRSNGILLTQVEPQGELIGGLSSVVQLDAWNLEDAVVKKNVGLHIYFPSYKLQTFGRQASTNREKQYQDLLVRNAKQMEEIENFFKAARSYNQEAKHNKVNLKLEAVKGLFDGSLTLFAHAVDIKQLLSVVDLVNLYNFNTVIVGGAEAYQIASILANHKIAVILNDPHSLPENEDDAVDQPYKNASQLFKAGVLVAINDNQSNTRYRNLSYQAGTAATYGLTPEEALSTITLNPAKILGISKEFGSIEEGKSATLFLAENDILDMNKSSVLEAFIQGRKINLDNYQKQLYHKYKFKYGVK